MGDRSGYNARQRGRIIEAVTAAVAIRTPGDVWSVDSLMFEEVGLQASLRRPASATPSQLRWVRGVVAEAMAQREQSAFR